MRAGRILVLSLLLGTIGPSMGVAAPTGKPPKGRALKEAVARYLDAPFLERERMRAAWDRDLAPLTPGSLPRLRKDLLKVAAKHGPTLQIKSGDHHFYEGKRGRYIVGGRAGKTLFVGLHGGGQGSGDAGSSASAMSGGGWWWIHPEVLKKTEVGWRDNGTEEFVVELIRAAKRSGKVDPNRIYITGHSMGGGGSWMFGGHHSDLFAGVAAYAGAPTPIFTDRSRTTIKSIAPGFLPGFHGLPLHVFQSGDDKNVPPGPNDFAMKALEGLQARWPGAFPFTYDRVEGRGHAAPAEGYLPSQKRIASQVRNPRPKVFLWQPVLSWKRHMYWVYWSRPEEEALLEFRAPGENRVEILSHEGSGDTTGMSLLLGEPLVDLSKDVVVTVDGEEVFRGRVPRTFSTLMMTLPRHDEHLLFDARIDL